MKGLGIFFNKIRRRFIKLRLQPIRVFCFHVVTDVYDSQTTWECDWIQTNSFKQKILELQHNNEFISISEAYRHINHDIIRRKRYCVLTCDDGIASVKQILPWLYEKNIPITLFVNPACCIGESHREKPMSFLTTDDLLSIHKMYNGLVIIANHGYDHSDCTKLQPQEFRQRIRLADAFFKELLPEKSPFFAYPCGIHSATTDSILYEELLIPVYCDGLVNYNESTVIHRELL